jgi:hypothetical protein
MPRLRSLSAWQLRLGLGLDRAHPLDAHAVFVDQMPAVPGDTVRPTVPMTESVKGRRPVGGFCPRHKSQVHAVQGEEPDVLLSVAVPARSVLIYPLGRLVGEVVDLLSEDLEPPVDFRNLAQLDGVSVLGPYEEVTEPPRFVGLIQRSQLLAPTLAVFSHQLSHRT